jgi:hypothetical protein
VRVQRHNDEEATDDRGLFDIALTLRLSRRGARAAG